MCGIAGHIDLKSFKKINPNKILTIMNNRGPDESGSFFNLANKYTINLFHSRLTIIDDNIRSTQPFHFRNYTLIYNGELYNYKEIKKKLENYGYSFITESDTEIVIKSYDKWGEKCLNYFDGMWALCIYDKKKDRLFLSRDIFGEKPLYFYRNNKNFIFGSEIKYIFSLGKEIKDLDKVNPKQIDIYLKQGYRFLNKKDNTFFKNIKKFESSCYYTVDLNNLRIDKKYYFKKSFPNKNKPINKIEAIKKIKNLMIETVQSRMISDFPIGFYLSGGIDSGSVASIASKILGKKIECFSIIDKDKRYNEEKNIDIVTKDLNCNTTKIKFPKKHDFINHLTKLINYHDSPISTPSYYTQSFIHEEVKKKNIKVLVSGLGGDEMFSGYFDHYLMHLYQIKNKKNYKENLDNWHKYIKPIIRNPNLKNTNIFKNNKLRTYLRSELELSFRKNYFKNYNVERFYDTTYSTSILKNAMLNEIFHESVPVICHEDDLNSMMQSIENRCPILNKNILNFTMTLNEEMFIEKGFNKFLFRESMKGILTDEVRLDRKKVGFNADINSLIKLNDKKTTDLINTNNDIHEFIDTQKLATFLKNTKNTSNEYSKFIFGVLNVVIFFKKYSL